VSEVPFKEGEGVDLSVTECDTGEGDYSDVTSRIMLQLDQFSELCESS